MSPIYLLNGIALGFCLGLAAASAFEGRPLPALLQAGIGAINIPFIIWGLS